jgi:hypothetical protein
VATKVTLSEGDSISLPTIGSDEPQSAGNGPDSASGAPTDVAEKKPTSWPQFLKTATVQDIHERLAKEIAEIISATGLNEACYLMLFEPADSIDSYDLDQMFAALNTTNADRKKGRCSVSAQSGRCWGASISNQQAMQVLCAQ